MVSSAEVDPNSDLRPHYFDPIMKIDLMINSGSQVTAFPPEPGDVEDSNVILKAVNGTNIKTFGFKEITVKINRKPYSFRAIKADVEKPVIGWDFMRTHRLDMRWGEFGDLFLYDKRAKIAGLLNIKSIPKETSEKHLKLALMMKSEKAFVDSLPFQIAALEKLSESPQVLTEEENIDILPDSPYKNILNNYPELLKQSFSEEHSKNKTQHRIPTGSAKPTKAKTRRLLPGSPKAIKAKQAWMQLVDLGIVEKVDPETPNIWSSPIHFVPKSDGSLRPVGDYRALNSVTELDQYKLPHLRDYIHEIAGSRVFSKVDLRKAFHLICIAKEDQMNLCHYPLGDVQL